LRSWKKPPKGTEKGGFLKFIPVKGTEKGGDGKGKTGDQKTDDEGWRTECRRQ
jgi:hypothetical protein